LADPEKFTLATPPNAPARLLSTFCAPSNPRNARALSLLAGPFLKCELAN
jgi:hypothetical protein